MPYSAESRRILLDRNGGQCDITTYSGRGVKLEAHSITRDHYLDSEGYPTDGMVVEQKTHRLLHSVAERGNHDLSEISIQAMEANLFGIASQAIANGRVTEGLRVFLEKSYERIDGMRAVLDGQCDSKPMTRKEIKQVKDYYHRKGRRIQGNNIKNKEPFE